MKRHYVYMTTNILNSKKYIGKRTCDCKINEDEYLGSGVELKEEISLYGKEVFKKEILGVFPTENAAFEYEEFLISKLKANEDDCFYNKSKGGGGVHCKKRIEQENLNSKVDIFKIKEYRKFFKISQEKMAIFLDISLRSYQMKEKGESEFFALELYKLSKVFEVDINELFCVCF